MTSPYMISSTRYTDALEVLELMNDKPEAFNYLIHDLNPDAQGTYKKVYYGSSIRYLLFDGDIDLLEEIFEDEDRIDNSVYLFEIGSVAFEKSRKKLMQKLQKYSLPSYMKRDNLIIPELVADTRVQEYDDNGKVKKVHYCVITRSRRCQMDLSNWFSRQRDVDAIKLVSQFVDLFVVLSDLLNDGLYFTDVKAENVIHCGDHLAFIDLDSLLTVSDALRGRGGLISYPARGEYLHLKKIFTASDKTTEERKKSTILFFRLYTLFAFSSMVLRYYWRAVRGNNLTSDNLPTQTELENDFKGRIPRHISGRHNGMELLLLSQKTMKTIFEENFDRRKAVKLLENWTTFSNLVPSSRKRKREEEEGSSSELRIRIPPNRALLF